MSTGRSEVAARPEAKPEDARSLRLDSHHLWSLLPASQSVNFQPARRGGSTGLMGLFLPGGLIGPPRS